MTKTVKAKKGKMGMFDYLKCDAPLPETEVAPPSEEYFQTKDTPDQYMTSQPAE